MISEHYQKIILDTFITVTKNSESISRDKQIALVIAERELAQLEGGNLPEWKKALMNLKEKMI